MNSRELAHRLMELRVEHDAEITIYNPVEQRVYDIESVDKEDDGSITIAIR